MPLPLPELFSEKVLFVTVALAVLKTPPPWPPWALLAEKLLLMMLSVPKKASIPAPSPPFAEQMLLVTVSLPKKVKIPPPNPALLPAKVLLVTVSPAAL
jgi:hypothetical protein